MSEPLIHDLDVLRPKPEYIKLGGHKIDISGVAMDVMERQQELIELTNTPEKLKEVEEGGQAAKRSFEIAAELCASITSIHEPEMDKEWLLKNTDVVQLKALIDHVTAGVMRSLNNVGDESLKKTPAAEGNP